MYSNVHGSTPEIKLCNYSYCKKKTFEVNRKNMEITKKQEHSWVGNFRFITKRNIFCKNLFFAFNIPTAMARQWLK